MRYTDEQSNHSPVAVRAMNDVVRASATPATSGPVAGRSSSAMSSRS